MTYLCKESINLSAMNLHLNTTQDIWHGVTVIFVCFVLVSIAVLVDLYTGIRAAKKTGEPIRSHILRKTITKTTDYAMVVLFGVLIDILGLPFKWYSMPFAAMLITLSVLIIEGRSVLENLTRAKSRAAEVDDVASDIIQKIIDAKTSKTATKVWEEIVKGGKE